MPLPEIANTYRCTLNWAAYQGVSPRNVIHVFSDTGNETDVFNTLEANLAGEMFQGMSLNQPLESISVLPLDSNSATSIHTVTADINGGGDTEVMPQCAAVVSLRTHQRGSRGRGRLYVGPLCEDMVSSGMVNPATLDVMNPAWETFLSDMTGDGRPLVVASYLHADQHAVQTATVDAVQGTMRRRQDQLR